ncbi:MAG TPA: hypothetical protein VFG69_01625 [Nannocystaceae bacterium]|nr:hypothetical protein [Nannocystaceae bacterium]
MVTRLRAAALLVLTAAACGPASDSEAPPVAYIFVPSEYSGEGTLTATHEDDREHPLRVQGDCSDGVEIEVGVAGMWQVALVCHAPSGDANYGCLVDVPQSAIDSGETLVACEG